MGKEFNIADMVIERLQVGQLRSEHVEELAADAAQFEKAGVRIRKILDNGQPWPDEIVIEGDLPTDQVSTLVELMNLRRLAELRVFPKGIPWPDILNVHVRLGARDVPGRFAGPG